MTFFARTFFASAALVSCCTPEIAAAQSARFDVPREPVADAVRRIGRQGGVQIIVSGDVARGRTGNVVSGSMPVEQALSTLLADTGLEARKTGERTFVIVRSQAQTSALSAQGGASQLLPETIGAPILVTAQRRTEPLQDVPVSVSAFNRDQLEDFRLNNFQDVSRLVPNLLVSAFSPGRPILAIRGATNTFNQIGVDKPVGVIVDDVVISRSSAHTLELFGVESVQVLRGPQGTLFGRNVTGGAIVIDTGRPEFGESRGQARAFYGEYDTVELDGLVDFSPDDRSAIRLAGMVRRSDGWGFDRLTGQRLDNQDSFGLRAQGRLAVSDRVEALFAGDISRDETGGRTLSSIGVGDDGDRRTSEVGVPQNYLRRQGGASLRIIADTGIGELTSITAWRRSKTDEVFSNVGANFRFLTGTQSQALTDDADNAGTLTQEVRLASPQWEWGNFLIGAFVLDEDARRQLRSTALAAVTGALVTDVVIDQRVRSRSAAIFADGTINITPELAVSLGGRYTIDTKRASINRQDRRNAANSFVIEDLETTWREFTPRAVIRFEPTPDLMAYGSWSRGYTAGGYNTEAAVAAAFRQPFAPERVENFEIGIRTQWLDRKLTFNVTAFHMNYRDKQELFFNNQTRVLNIVNAARATMRGVEVEAAFKPAPWLSLGVNYGHLDTRYDDFVIPGGADNTGNRLGSSPENKVAVFGDIRVPVGPGAIIANASYAYTGNYFTGAARDLGLFVDSYELVNASIGYASADERVTITAFARNLFDEEFLLIPSVQVVRSQYLGAPRVAGVNVAVRF